MATFEHVDGRVAAHHAATIRADAGRVGGLPADLVEGRRAQAVAKQDAGDAAAASALLDADALKARQEADDAAVAVRSAVDNVAAADAIALLAEMRAAEVEAVRLRALVVGFANGRTLSDPPLPSEIMGVGLDPWHGPLIASVGRWDDHSGVWARYKQALAQDAGAKLE